VSIARPVDAPADRDLVRLGLVAEPRGEGGDAAGRDVFNMSREMVERACGIGEETLSRSCGTDEQDSVMALEPAGPVIYLRALRSFGCRVPFAKNISVFTHPETSLARRMGGAEAIPIHYISYR
jgi:hypothetical protein